ncbi:MAG: autotransporter domain-containing protein [Bauldia sp.]
MSQVKFLRNVGLAIVAIAIAAVAAMNAATAAPSTIALFEGNATPQSFTIPGTKVGGTASFPASISGPCQISNEEDGVFGASAIEGFTGGPGAVTATFWVRATPDQDPDALDTACVVTLGTGTSFTPGSEQPPAITVYEVQPSVTIIKNSIGGTATFDFTTTNFLDANNDFDLNTGGDDTEEIVFFAGPGTYQVTEQAETGFTLTGLVCVDPDNGTTTAGATATIDLDLGEAITCTFTNTSTTGTITIIKNSLGGNANFGFTTDGDLDPNDAFNLNTNGNPGGTAQEVFTSVAPGTYTVTEDGEDGFTLTELTCVDPDDQTTTNLQTGTATIDLDAGEAITCTFTNTVTPPPGSITIIKNSVGGTANFGFTIDGGLDPNDAFSLNTTANNGTAQTVFTSVEPGTYTVIEDGEDGFVLTDLTCDDPNGGTTTDLQTGTATIVLDDEEAIVCTFTNTAPSSITIIKNSVGGNAAFDFTTDNDLAPGNNFVLNTNPDGTDQTAFNDLAPGTYTVTEDEETDFTLTDLVCVDPDEETTTEGATATIVLAAGEAIVCTFTNTYTPSGSITIVKNSVGGTAEFDFTTTNDLAGATNAFTLDTTGDFTQSVTFTDVSTGTYVVTELAEGGFSLTGLVCDDATGTTSTLGSVATIDFTEGDTVICTFTNTAQGSLTITKNTVGGDGTFYFTGDLGAFSVVTAGGTASSVPATLPPGTYLVTEEIDATFALTGLTCSDGSSTSIEDRTATIELEAGETIVCTFTNTEVAGRTAAIIENFIANRANTLMEAGPSLKYFLDRFNGRAGGCSGSPLLTPEGLPVTWTGSCQLATLDARLSFWIEATFERYRQGGEGDLVEGRVRMFQGGLDYLFGDRLILGITALIDGAQEVSTDRGYRVEGLGWMAGPYGAARLGDNIIFDAKILWGTSENDIHPFLNYTDVYHTTRWLATARLGGEHTYGPVIVRPEMEFVYFRETQREYVDQNGITIPEQVFSRGRLTFGPEIAIPLVRPNGTTIEPFMTFQGVWDITASQLSARLEGGFRVTDGDGMSFQLMGTLGGIFVPDYRSWGVKASLTVPLQ